MVHLFQEENTIRQTCSRITILKPWRIKKKLQKTALATPPPPAPPPQHSTRTTAHSTAPTARLFAICGVGKGTARRLAAWLTLRPATINLTVPSPAVISPHPAQQYAVRRLPCVCAPYDIHIHSRRTCTHTAAVEWCFPKHKPRPWHTRILARIERSLASQHERRRLPTIQSCAVLRTRTANTPCHQGQQDTTRTHSHRKHAAPQS